MLFFNKNKENKVSPTPMHIGVSPHSERGFTPTSSITKFLKATRFAHRYERCRGFTLIEIVVVLGIIVLFTGLGLVNYGSARNSFRLDNAMQEVLLTLRETQIYGTSVLENTKTPGGSFNDAYGIAFEEDSSGYIRFVDVNDNKKYDPGGTPPVEEIETINFTGNFEIKDLCIPIANCGEDDLYVTFKRPNPDAIIRKGGGSINELSAKIIVEDKSTGATKNIIIEKAGQIYIQ